MSDVRIRSLHADDPELEERLERFTVGLGERIDVIQEDEAAGALERVAEQAQSLAAEAAELGFPVLERAAAQAAGVAASGDTAGTHKSLVQLTEVVRRVRLGHRPLP